MCQGIRNYSKWSWWVCEATQDGAYHLSFRTPAFSLPLPLCGHWVSPPPPPSQPSDALTYIFAGEMWKDRKGRQGKERIIYLWRRIGGAFPLLLDRSCMRDTVFVVLCVGSLMTMTTIFLCGCVCAPSITRFLRIVTTLLCSHQFMDCELLLIT